jgi:uncharacterized membrane protein YfcA
LTQQFKATKNMWQRIQTVFLLVVIISLVVSVIQPIWKFENGASLSVLTSFYFLSGEEYQYFPYSVTAILTIASITMAFISIRKFKNRLLQMKLGALNSLFIAATIMVSVYFANQLTDKFHGGKYGVGFFLPAVAVVCNFLANRFIRRDERMVRDSERLR